VSGACIVGACVGFAASLGKLAFDSILQRDAPDANRGRSFARFETRFQIFYVAGSLIPVAFHVGARLGFGLLLAASAFAIASYAIGRMAWAHRTGERQTAATAAAVGIEERFAEVSGEVKGRLAAAPRNVMQRFRGDGTEVPEDDDQTVIIEPATALTDPGEALTERVPADEIDAPPTWGGADDPTSVPEEPTTELFDQDLAPGSPVAWTPPEDRPV